MFQQSCPRPFCLQLSTSPGYLQFSFSRTFIPQVFSGSQQQLRQMFILLAHPVERNSFSEKEASIDFSAIGFDCETYHSDTMLVPEIFMHWIPMKPERVVILTMKRILENLRILVNKSKNREQNLKLCVKRKFRVIMYAPFSL